MYSYGGKAEFSGAIPPVFSFLLSKSGIRDIFFSSSLMNRNFYRTTFTVAIEFIQPHCKLGSLAKLTETSK